MPFHILENHARIALRGVGDPAAGEWIDRAVLTPPPRVLHLRRRLSGLEASTVGEVEDVRGTARAELIARRMALVTGMQWEDLLELEMSPSDSVGIAIVRA